MERNQRSDRPDSSDLIDLVNRVSTVNAWSSRAQQCLVSRYTLAGVSRDVVRGTMGNIFSKQGTLEGVWFCPLAHQTCFMKVRTSCRG